MKKINNQQSEDCGPNGSKSPLH